MSINYAEALSPHPNKGKLGEKEIFDTQAEVESKVDQLVQYIRDSKFVVVLTGAGISTSAGIPDFRGPQGVWTLEEKNEKPASVDFLKANPTFTHYALVALERVGKLKHLISQNVDNLHIRSGFPAARLVEVHGNCFVNICKRCSKIYYRKEPTKTVGLKSTGKRCTVGKCRGYIYDTVLDWHDLLPDPFYTLTEPYIRKADLFIVLGSSLQVKPVGDLPNFAKKDKPCKTVYINLQKINKKCFDLAIHHPVDSIMKAVMQKLDISVTEEEAEEPVIRPTFPLEFDGVISSVENKKYRKIKEEPGISRPEEEKNIKSLAKVKDDMKRLAEFDASDVHNTEDVEDVVSYLIAKVEEVFPSSSVLKSLSNLKRYSK